MAKDAIEAAAQRAAAQEAANRIRIQDLINDRLAELSPQEEAKIDGVTSGPETSELLIYKFNIDMTREKMTCLKRGIWLNDEIINFYMEMLKERDVELCKLDPSRKPSHLFSSFFYSKLMEDGRYDYSRVKRWAKRFDVFAQEKIFVPINIGNNHWVLSVIYIQSKKIVFYDSFHNNGEKFNANLFRWLQDEHLAKKGMPMDTEGWTFVDETPIDAPRQLNGSDCGVFVVIACDFLLEDLPLAYDQNTVTPWRKNLGAAILRGSLNYRFLGFF